MEQETTNNLEKLITSEDIAAFYIACGMFIFFAVAIWLMNKYMNRRKKHPQGKGIYR